MSDSLQVGARPADSTKPCCYPRSITNSHSNVKIYGMAVLIILSLGVLATGVLSYLDVGALSNLGKINGIIMMGSGGGVTFIALSIMGVYYFNSVSPNNSKQSSTDPSNPKLSNLKKKRHSFKQSGAAGDPPQLKSLLEDLEQFEVKKEIPVHPQPLKQDSPQPEPLLENREQFEVKKEIPVQTPKPVASNDQVPNGPVATFPLRVAKLKVFSDQRLQPLQEHFSQIKSGHLVDKMAKADQEKMKALSSSGVKTCIRNVFGTDPNWHIMPPLISKSSFISDEMVEHLMRRKKDTAVGVKYEHGDHISNMEGALHALITPICSISIKGDHSYRGGHRIEYCPEGKTRQVVMSAAVQPDLEDLDVIMNVISLQDEAFVGESRSIENLTTDQKTHADARKQYDEQLKRFMVYHLTSSHSLPAKNDVTPMELDAARQYLEEAITSQEFDISDLRDKFVRIKIVDEIIISLELFWNIYVEQLINEFSALEFLLPQGYNYTIDPPSIFVRILGRKAWIPNRLQILALKHVYHPDDFKNLKGIYFNGFEDPACIKLLQSVVTDKQIGQKSALFPNDRYHSEYPDYALVIHNNSDGFGQNIETESPTSMDGIIGCNSDAACVLRRDRPDLLDYVY